MKSAVPGLLHLARSLVIAAVLVMSGMMTTAVIASPRPTTTATRPSFATPPSTPVEIDRKEFEAFLDGFVQRAMNVEHVPGVVFYMVKDGEVFLAKGYGYADVERKIPMDPHSTVLSVGSITKIFTATACMQLVEHDKLDLFADVNDALKAFHIPDTFPEPITLAHLLEHTDGLDVAHIGIAARTEADVLPLETYLARHLPPRVRPPGLSAAYGEHGMTLAGYLVQVASGEPYEQYMHEHLLDPLNMRHSDFRIRADMQSNVCVGYTWANGALHAVQPEFAYHVIPAAGLLATAEDIGQFMQMHLNSGRYGDHELLAPATAKLMLMPKFGLNPQLSAWSYGFHSRYHGHEFCIEHGGMSLRSVSQLLIMPERHIGFFIAGNTISQQLDKQFVNAFLERYFGPGVGDTDFRADAPGVIDAHEFEGTYAALNRSETTIERLNSISHQTQVIATSPKMLHTVSSFDTIDWMRIGPALYESAADEARIAFVMDSERRVRSMLNGPHECLRLQWWETVQCHRALFAIMGAVFASGCFGQVGLAFLRWRQSKLNPMTMRGCVRAFALTSLCAINLLFIVGLAVVVRRTDPFEYLFGLPWKLHALLWLPIVSVALTPVVAGFALAAWTDHVGSLLRRLHESLIAITALLFLVIVTHWNLLGFNVV